MHIMNDEIQISTIQSKIKNNQQWNVFIRGVDYEFINIVLIKPNHFHNQIKINDLLIIVFV